ncbi:hypothetical protein [Elioraea sp.]|uniref:hypothetical protein n=1 Tax=Elioraea sp. TaxID=2185103 RepID=UPI0025C2BCDC|nr:hypothetical protein [Elioraea sp.]
MRNIIGLVFIAAGAWMLFSALARRRRVIAAGPDAAPPLNPSLQAMADAMPPIILLVLGIVGAKVALAMVMTEAGQYFSLLDLAGFLFLLAGYGTSVVIRTRYREAPR